MYERGTADTPGDGNQKANAMGTVLSTETPPQEGDGDKPIQVADLRSCTYSMLVVLSMCFGDPNVGTNARKPVQPILPAPQVQIIQGPKPK
jgi:hypothetical protein